MSLLQCRQLRIMAGPRVLINALDWQVAPGELWCLLGPNGVGKSTLLYTLAGLLQPAAGEVVLNGKPLATASLAQLARARGLMAQQQVDAFSASVLDTVLVGRTPYRFGIGGRLDHTWDSHDDLAAAQAALAAVGMADFASTDVLQLSGGERQRVALATLLAQAPALMLLDEPTAHQDVARQLAIMRLVRARAAQHGVIVTTHDINLAARFATHVLLLSADACRAGPVESMLTCGNLESVFGCGFEMIADRVPHTFVAR